MLVLGLQGSPRLKGNSNYLLSIFMKEAENLGADVITIDVTKKKIKPCMEYLTCEKNGFCPIKDEIETEFFPLFREADVVVFATPMFFYSCSAQMKILIDRTQALWARKYRLNITDPGRKWRKGYMLALGATKGKNLFEGMMYTAKYFYDAVGASFNGSLTYRGIEFPGDMEKHPTVHEDVKKAVKELLDPLILRKKMLFISHNDSALGQMASGFARLYGGDRLEVMSGGLEPLTESDQVMKEAMREKGIDMEYIRPKAVKEIMTNKKFDMVVFTEGMIEGLNVSCNNIIKWDFPFISSLSIEDMRMKRDEIEGKIKGLIDTI